MRLDLVAADAVERARRNRPGVSSRPTSRSRSSTARRPLSSARSRTCSTTRPSGARPAVRSKSSCVTARSSCATTAPGSTTRTFPYVFDRFYRARSARGPAGLGPRPRRSTRRSGRGRRHAHAPAAERPPPGLRHFSRDLSGRSHRALVRSAENPRPKGAAHGEADEAQGCSGSGGRSRGRRRRRRRSRPRQLSPKRGEQGDRQRRREAARRQSQQAQRGAQEAPSRTGSTRPSRPAGSARLRATR